MPERIAFSSWSGTGQQERGQTVELRFAFTEQSGNGGGQTPSANVFYRKHAVITDKRNYDYLFTYCGPERPSEDFIGKNYDRVKYAAEFNEYMDRYTGSAFDERFGRRPQPLASLTVPNTVKTIPNAKSKPTAYTYTGSGGPGVQYDGDVVLKETYNASYTVSPMTAAGYAGVAIQASGNVSIPDWNSGTTINGKLVVGGSFSAANGSSITINGDAWIRGNMAIGQIGTLTVKGNLIVNGNADFTGSVDKLVVEGDLIVGGDMTFSSNLNGLVVNKSISAGKDMKFSTAALISAGKWTAAGQIDGNDRNSIVAGAKFSYGRIDSLRATGDFSAMTYAGSSELARVTLGGSFLSGGDVSLPSSVANWTIPGSISVGGSLTVGSTQKFAVGDSIYAASGVTFAKVESSFVVGGSILSPGTIYFSNTLQLSDIRGDIISSRSKIQFAKPVNDLTVGGSIAAASDIEFMGETTIHLLSVAKDLVSSGSIVFGNTLEGGIVIGGMAAALRNIDLKNTFDRAGTRISLGGFYAGATMTAPDYYREDWGNGKNAICINYNPPAGGKTDEPSKQLVLTTTWSSRSYRRP